MVDRQQRPPQKFPDRSSGAKPRRWNSKPDPIRDAIKVFLRDAGLHRSPQNQLVFDTWKQVLGTLALRAIPVRFSRGELVLEVDSAVHLQEFRNFTGEGYRRRVNKTLDNELVRKLTFKLKG